MCRFDLHYVYICMQNVGDVMIQALDHIQLALPAGAEDRMRVFYCDLLAMVEVRKPAALRKRGGFWVLAGDLQVHFGVDPDFHPATKAHPAFLVADVGTLAQDLGNHGYDVAWDLALPDVRRFFCHDPVGNRLEFMAMAPTA